MLNDSLWQVIDLGYCVAIMLLVSAGLIWVELLTRVPL